MPPRFRQGLYAAYIPRQAQIFSVGRGVDLQGNPGTDSGADPVTIIPNINSHTESYPQLPQSFQHPQLWKLRGSSRKWNNMENPQSKFFSM